jgi:hypothetical protein
MRFQMPIPARVPPSLVSIIPILLVILTLSAPRAVRAGVANPDISALGQVLGSHTDDPGSPDADQPALRLGEAEFIFDAYLNPYIKGWFTLSGGEDGFALEEAYASVIKGLPWGLNLKAGKYRLGFGKLNSVHPHAYPFIDAPRSLQSLLFGEEGFNETGVQVSALLPTPGDWASTLSADLIEGKAFHEASDGPDGSGTRLGAVGRWANNVLIGERGAFETGVSGATGIDSVGRDSRAWLAGADAKAKFYLPSSSQLVIQGEAVFKHSHLADTATGAFPAEDRAGFYAFADYRWHSRWNGGLLYEQWEREGDPSSVDRAFRAFGGFAVMEESTLLRLAYERFLPRGEAAVNTFTLQLLFSMGPHKAHQF